MGKRTLFAAFCEHANEVPMTCRCPENCYCKKHTCKKEKSETFVRTPKKKEGETIHSRLVAFKKMEGVNKSDSLCDGDVLGFVQDELLRERQALSRKTRADFSGAWPTTLSVRLKLVLDREMVRALSLKDLRYALSFMASEMGRRGKLKGWLSSCLRRQKTKVKF